MNWRTRPLRRLTSVSFPVSLTVKSVGSAGRVAAAADVSGSTEHARTAATLARTRMPIQTSTGWVSWVLLGASPAPGRSDLEGREANRRGLDRCLAVRAHLPERLERCLAVDACLLQLRRADRTDEEFVRDLRPADRTVEVAPREPLLHRLDLELPLPHVLEILRRPEEHVDQRADVGNDETDRDGGCDQDRIFDPPLGVLVDPVADGEPERDQEEIDQVQDHVPRA